uniref:putative F-box protein At1g47765 n=1 Tax=Erigeron canadensis TaxID=72917 RepID=UPI001CB923E8|nr:putative F-box protein At1g47765 [Erigeron canadensis]
MSEYVPIEIQAEILKRLPLKPLIQFRSVSKSYKCLIDSPNFVDSYSVGHPQPPGDRFILRYVNYDPKYLTLVDNDDHSFAQQQLIPVFPDPFYTLSVVGGSHGLLCFYGYYEYRYHMFLLWNPAIRKSVGIQVPVMYDEKVGNIGFDDVVGFGVCPVTFDPTIIKIRCVNYKQKMKDMPDISVPWKVRVFTLSTGTWSILSTDLPREAIRLSGSQVVIDRFIYWLAYDYMLEMKMVDLNHIL